MGELKLNVADGEEDLKELEANQEGLESAFDDCLGGGQLQIPFATDFATDAIPPRAESLSKQWLS